jgi:anti-anti-sigma factor
MPVVRLRGRLDVASAPAFRYEVRELMKAGAATLVLDMSELASIDSAGLGAVIGGLRLARQAGGDLRIAVPNRLVRHALKLTSLDRVLKPYESVDEALADAPPIAVELALRMSDPAAQLDALHEGLTNFLDSLFKPPPPEWRMLFELAVSEIAANIIEHARPPSVHLHLGIQGGSVVAEFTDAGKGWDGPPGPAEVVDQLLERGRGLSLAKTALDEMAYERTGQTNRWRLAKRLNPEESVETEPGSG